MFVAGDAFEMITPRCPFYDEPDTPRPVLKSLTSLTPLQGHVSAIHASAFFHLFGEEKQQKFARRIATLLSPAPGSVVFGLHVGNTEKGYITDPKENQKRAMFCHSPESWSELWDGEVFKKGTVRVEAWTKEVERVDLGPGAKFFLLIWAVTRL